jgi:hypothetical protein
MGLLFVFCFSDHKSTRLYIFCCSVIQVLAANATLYLEDITVDFQNSDGMEYITYARTRKC